DYRIVFYFSLGGVLVGFVLSLVTSGLHAHGLVGAALLLAIGLLATVAQLMMTRAYAIGHPLSNAALQYTGIVFAYAWGALVFGDEITAFALAGIALIVAAGLAATLLRARVVAPRGRAADAPGP
ncbi:MAG: EamA/RhaT family transporter, partial [Rubrivivax sp.]